MGYVNSLEGITPSHLKPLWYHQRVKGLQFRGFVKLNNGTGPRTRSRWPRRCDMRNATNVVDGWLQRRWWVNCAGHGWYPMRWWKRYKRPWGPKVTWFPNDGMGGKDECGFWEMWWNMIEKRWLGVKCRELSYLFFPFGDASWRTKNQVYKISILNQ